MTYFMDKAGCNYVSLKFKDGLKLAYAKQGSTWTSQYKGQVAASIEAVGTDFDYVLKMKSLHLTLDISEVAELALLLKEFTRGEDFNKYIRIDATK